MITNEKPHAPFLHASFDRFPMTLDSLNGISRHLVVDKATTRETAIQKLTRFYLNGFDRYAKRKSIFSDLPHTDLWPDKYADAYNWMLDAYNVLEGSPQLIFDEVIRNADLHGKGFRGATAAWLNPSIFIFRIADKGTGLGSSGEHGDNIGHIFISHFATEPIRTKVQRNGHILGFCRNLDTIELPDRLGMLGTEDISGDIAFIQQRRAAGKKLPQYHPDSRKYYGFDSKVGKFGATVVHNRLGKVIQVIPFDHEPEPWD